MNDKRPGQRSQMRLRPHNGFIQEAELDELHILTEHWVSDMMFYTDELTFFHTLVDRYFILLLKEDHIHEARSIIAHIQEQEKSANDLKIQMLEHIDHIADLYDVEEKVDETAFRNEHQELEHRMIDFISAFTQTKREVFSLSQRMVEVEKLKAMLRD